MFENIRGLLLDMDGVVYHGTKRLDGVLEFFEWLSLPYLFVTNNSSRTPEQVAAKLQKMGLVAEPSQILTSSIVTADYLAKNAPPHTKIYMIGEIGLQTALENKGFVITSQNPTYVVVGLDLNFNDEKLQTAVKAIEQGAIFIGTNMDRKLMTENQPRPGTGTIIDKIVQITKQKPLIMGKPMKPIFEMAAERLDLPLSTLLMVGDNLETDIEGANNLDIPSILVMTGVTSKIDLSNSKIQPTLILDNLLGLKQIFSGN